MARKIQIKRGPEAELPKLDVAEFGFTTDTKKAFLGDSAGNIELAKQEQVNEVKAQLADNAISPESYNGTDFEKVQSAINDAISQKRSIRLSRIYDVTNTIPLKINKTGSRWTLRFNGEGGGFKKTNSGFMFSSDNTFAADLTFISVGFIGVAGTGTTIFDGDKIIIVNTSQCIFNNVDKYASSTTYLQSYRQSGDRVTGGVGYFFETPSVYDFSSDNVLVEVRESFFNQIKAPVGNEWTKLYQARFTNCAIEGLSGRAFNIQETEGLSIDGAYLEFNLGGNIVFASDSILDGVSISNVRGHESTSNPLPLIVWGGTINTAKTSNNHTNNAPVHNTTNVISGEIISEHDVSGNIKKEDIDPNKVIFKRGGKAWLRAESGTNVASYDFVKRLNKNTSHVINAGELKTVQILFSEELYRDDIISVQSLNSPPLTEVIICSCIRNSTDKKLLDVVIKNNHSVSLTVFLEATVLKIKGLGSQRG